MSVMERRLQLLLDASRYGRVRAEAERSGRSVAAVIREAIDLRFPDDGEDIRLQAADELLRMSTPAPSETADSPAALKQAYADFLDEKAARQ